MNCKLCQNIDKEYERNIREAEQRGINWNNPELLKARLDEERKRLLQEIEKEIINLDVNEMFAEQVKAEVLMVCLKRQECIEKTPIKTSWF